MSEKIDDGGPAFPTSELHEGTTTGGRDGVSMRDFFATHAPPMPGRSGGHPKLVVEALVEWNYQYADAMLRQRKRKSEPPT